MKEYILKEDLLNILKAKKDAWRNLKGKEQDVTHENFIDNVLLALEWISDEVENMKNVVKLDMNFSTETTETA